MSQSSLIFEKKVLTGEFLGFRIQNFQDIIFIWTQTYGELFKAALVYL